MTSQQRAVAKRSFDALASARVVAGLRNLGEGLPQMVMGCYGWWTMKNWDIENEIQKKKHGCFNPPSSAAVPPRHSRARWPGRSSTFPLISRPKIRCVGMSRIQKTKVTIPLPREIRDENHGWDGFFDLPIIRFTKLGNLGWNSGDEKKGIYDIHS